MKYTELIFDLYGTLVDIHTEENDTVWEKTALYLGYYGARYTGAQLKAAFQAVLTERQAAAGQAYECFPDIPIEQVFSQLLRVKGVTENAETLAVDAAQLFRVCSTKYIRLYDGVLDALATLEDQGCRLWLLSNAQRVFTAFELRQLGVEDKFHGIYISSDYGFRKPDRRFLGALLEEQGIDPEKCLMIGNDRQTDIAGAKAAGLATLYMHTNITPPGQAKADPTLHPAKAPKDCGFWEYEGADWYELTQLLCKYA